MSDAFDVPIEISDVTIVGPLPLPVTGTITTSPDVNIHDSAGGTLTSTGTALNVNVTDFPVIQTVAVSQTGTDNNVDANITNASLAVTGPLTDIQLRATPVPVTIPLPVPITDNGSSLTVDGTITALQGTSPWVVSGTISSSPDVNVHDGAGNTISSTGTSLNVDVTNTIPVTGPLTDIQLRASPVSVTIPTPVPVTDNGGSITVDGTIAVSNFPATQPVSGTVAATQSGEWDVNIEDTAGNALTSTANALDVNIKSTGVTQPVSGTVAVTQSTSPWVVSGTVTANLGTIDGVATEATLATRLADATFIGRINTQGQKTMAASTPVVIASDQSAVPVSGTVSITFPTGTLNNGAETAVAGTAVQVLATNTNRNKLIIQNTGIAAVRIGTTGVTATTGFRLPIGATIIMDNPECPTNAIFAIREGAVSSTVLAQEVV